MTRQSMFQAKKESQPLQTSSLFRRQAAQAPVEEREPAALPVNLGRDFSGIPFKPVHPAPALGPSSISCPFTPQRCPFGGACHACPPKMQAKLKIGQPGDRYEQEADHVAEQVMRMPEPQVQRKCSAPGCKDEDEDKLVQTKSAGSAGNAQVDHPLIQSVLSSPGQPLDAGTRSFMEPRFGQDFSGVRVHVGGQAAESARVVNARAYTVGRDVVFGEGQYAPGSDEGKRLVAHELVHVGQQGFSNLRIQREENIATSNFKEKFEKEFREIIQEFEEDDDFSPEAFKEMFGNDQIQILLKYFDDPEHLIPAGLFVNMNTIHEKLTAKRRLLIAAHILSHGKVKKIVNGKEIIDKPRAANCGAWVQAVWNYAGVTPSLTPSYNPSDKNSAKLGAVGLDETVSFGAGKANVFKTGNDDDKLPLWGEHNNRWKQQQEILKYNTDLTKENEEKTKNEKEAADQKSLSCDKNASSCKMDKQPYYYHLLPVSEVAKRKKALHGVLEELKPGDWIWIYNGNASAHHSLMFAGWSDDKSEKDTPNKKKAKIFNQKTNKIPFGQISKEIPGGVYQEIYLTDLDSKDPKEEGYPVVLHWQVGANATPAQTEKDILDKNDLDNIKNVEKFLQSKKTIDIDKFLDMAVKEANKVLNDTSNLNINQKKIFERIIKESSMKDIIDNKIENSAKLIAIIHKLKFAGKIDKKTMEQLVGYSLSND